MSATDSTLGPSRVKPSALLRLIAQATSTQPAMSRRSHAIPSPFLVVQRRAGQVREAGLDPPCGEPAVVTLVLVDLRRQRRQERFDERVGVGDVRRDQQAAHVYPPEAVRAGLEP